MRHIMPQRPVAQLLEHPNVQSGELGTRDFPRRSCRFAAFGNDNMVKISANNSKSTTKIRNTRSARSTRSYRSSQITRSFRSTPSYRSTRNYFAFDITRVLSTVHPILAYLVKDSYKKKNRYIFVNPKYMYFSQYIFLTDFYQNNIFVCFFFGMRTSTALIHALRSI